jgi:hypothetical protein
MKIEIRVDQARLGELVTVDEWCDLEDGKIKAMRSLLGKFIVNEKGEYLEPEAGRKVIGALTINQLNEASADFMRKAKESAVPNESGAA